jgi:hypothetical protein
MEANKRRIASGRNPVLQGKSVSLATFNRRIKGAPMSRSKARRQLAGRRAA